MPTPKPLNVYFFQNGMVIAYDESGMEIDEYRGLRSTTWPKIQPHLGPYSIVQGSTSGRVPPPASEFNLPTHLDELAAKALADVLQDIEQ